MRAGAFHRGKIHSFTLWCQLLDLQKPTGTRICSFRVKVLPTAMSNACFCASSSSDKRRPISSPPLTQGAMHDTSYTKKSQEEKKINRLREKIIFWESHEEGKSIKLGKKAEINPHSLVLTEFRCVEYSVL